MNKPLCLLLHSFPSWLLFPFIFYLTVLTSPSRVAKVTSKWHIQEHWKGKISFLSCSEWLCVHLRCAYPSSAYTCSNNAGKVAGQILIFLLVLSTLQEKQSPLRSWHADSLLMPQEYFLWLLIERLLMSMKCCVFWWLFWIILCTNNCMCGCLEQVTQMIPPSYAGKPGEALSQGHWSVQEKSLA